MTLPRRYNRRIVVGGEEYVWYVNSDDLFGDSKHIAVRLRQWPRGQLLLIDAYAYELGWRPRSVHKGIEFALANGWRPKEKAVPMYIGHDNVRFVLLPRGEEYVTVYQKPVLPWVRR